MRSAWALLLLGACGRIAFDGRSDAAPAVGTDGPLGPFGAPQALSVLNSPAEDDDITLTDDELEAYFASSRSGGMGLVDIWSSTRATISDPWSAPTDVTELSSAQADSTPELSVDGLTMYFARGQVSEFDIYVTTRASRGAPWSMPALVSELAAAGSETAPAPSPDQLMMLFTRGAVTANAQLMLVTRPTLSSAWSAPVVVLDDPDGQESQAWVGDEWVYFTVNTNTPPLQTIYAASRTGPTTFGPRFPVAEIDLPGDDSDPWVSSSLRSIYFEHADDLYHAVR